MPAVSSYSSNERGQVFRVPAQSAFPLLLFAPPWFGGAHCCCDRVPAGFRFCCCRCHGFAEVHGQQETSTQAPHHHATAKHRHVPSNAHASHRASSTTTRHRDHQRTRRPPSPAAITASRRAKSPAAAVIAAPLSPPPSCGRWPSNWRKIPRPPPLPASPPLLIATPETPPLPPIWRSGHAYLLQHKFADAVTALHDSARGRCHEDQPGRPSGRLRRLPDRAGIPAEQSISSGGKGSQRTMCGNIRTASLCPASRSWRPIFSSRRAMRSRLCRCSTGTAPRPLPAMPTSSSRWRRPNNWPGRTEEAQRLFEHVYLGYPLSTEAGVARAQLVSSGALDKIPGAERRRHADALYGAGHYAMPRLNIGLWPASRTCPRRSATNCWSPPPSATGS